MSIHLHKATVLILNRHWHPLTATTPAEILGAMVNDQAVALEIRSVDWIEPVPWNKWQNLSVRIHDASVGTTRGPVRLPTVVVLSHFHQLPIKNKYGVADWNIFLPSASTTQSAS